MSTIEKHVLMLINENRTNELGYYIDKKISSTIFRKKNQKEIIRLLPIIIEYTNKDNYSWLTNHTYHFYNKEFLTSLINNIDKFDFQNNCFTLNQILISIRSFSTNLLDEDLLKTIR